MCVLFSIRMATPDIMCETLKMTVDELLRQNHLAICQMPKDGLCLILACAEALNVSKEHIVERLNSELAKIVSIINIISVLLGSK